MIKDHSLLAQLKEHTQGLHDSVEEAMNSEALMHPDFSKEEYRLLLKRLWWAHSTLEPALEDCNDIMQYPGLKAKQRLNKRSLLQKDLEELGVSPEELPATEAASLSAEECWGALYVLEGSTLGGAMIYKKLSEQEGTDFPLRFYGAYGRDTGAMWSSFRKIFTEKTSPPEEWNDPVIKGAEKAYRHFLEAAEQFKA
ncbi:MAG: biliverdin-producing heme oxygenase [Owenweeksia sp.]